MRLLANENFPRALVLALRADGHDVAWVWEDARGSKDPEVLGRAQREGRVIATYDKDFGELAFRARLPATCGVFLVRVVGSLETQTSLVRAALRELDSVNGPFVTVSNDRLRTRPLPTN